MKITMIALCLICMWLSFRVGIDLEQPAMFFTGAYTGFMGCVNIYLMFKHEKG